MWLALTAAHERPSDREMKLAVDYIYNYHNLTHEINTNH